MKPTPAGMFAIALAVVVVLAALLIVAGCTDAGQTTLVRSAEAATLDQAPPQARQYQRAIMREARVIWGLDAPIPALAAQLQQESDFRPDAQSPYAGGIAQFTPSTAAEMARLYPELAPADVYNPDWGIRAQNRYMLRLHDGLRDYPGGTHLDACHRYAMALAGYNGGPGGVRSDRDYAAATGRDPNQWWGQTEMLSRKNPSAFSENRGYVKRVLRVLQSSYRAWPGRYVCGELG